MKHRDTATEIKIWSEEEINCPKCRPKDYTNTYIHAIEPGASKGMYIVEVTMPKYCKEDQTWLKKSQRLKRTKIKKITKNIQ